jgi:Double-GTPase 1
VSVDRRIALLGLPRTGKSTFLGALWQIVQDPAQDQITEENVTGDRSYVDRLGELVARAEEIPRTEVDSAEDLAITLGFRGFGTAQVEVPDLSGESARQLVEDRIWRPRLDEAVQEADALMLFVHPDRIDVPVSIGFAQASGARAREGSTPQPAPDFSADRACTAAKLVDLLENVLEVMSAKAPVAVAVVISAWDRVAGSRTPAQWLSEQLPGVADMLASNPDLTRWSVFGLSAQGGQLPGERATLLEKGDISARVFAMDASGSNVGLSEPLRWAVWS